MAEDAVDVGFTIGPVTVSINGLLRRLFGRSKPNAADEVARRFLALFGAHGLLESQIPRLLPAVQLSHLRSRTDLLNALTPDVLDHTAALFGIRREWLDGADGRLYAPRTCYKQPSRFFADLAAVCPQEPWFPVRALFDGSDLDATRSGMQSLVLVMVARVGLFGDQEVSRYLVYSDAWNWTNGPARLQVKAMARLVCRILDSPIPLHRVSAKTLVQIREGQVVPHDFLQGCLLTEPSLEDFALAADESAKARETAELPSVLRYIEAMELERVASEARDTIRSRG